MSKKTLLFLLPTILAIFQLGYSAKIPNRAFSKPLLGYNAYVIFTEEVKSCALFFSLVILLSVICMPGTSQKNGNNKFWYLFFFAILLFAGITVAYTNPQGRFPWNTRENYIEVEVRGRKFEFYKKLKRTPDVILLGSSISFLEPTKYFTEKWGLQAFNLSVNKGGPVDFVNLVHIVEAKSPDSKMPLVVMAEIQDLSLALNYYQQTPLEYIPDMDSWTQQKAALWVTVSDIFDFHSFSDALFTFFFVDRGRWNSTTIMEPNGTLLRDDGDVKDNQYRKIVTKNIRLMGSMQTCEKLDKDGQAAIARLVELSHQYQFSLLFYRTPINRDFYIFSNTSPADYAQCTRIFNQYIESIVAQNPNVFFKDLSQYQPIATGGKELYIDTHHLTTKASAMLLDVLSPEIEKALQWAKENRP